MKEKRIVTLFPNTSNVQLVKDVGMIPFILHKVEGYHATIACYQNGEYPYLNKEVKGLNIIFIQRKFGNEILDGLWFILKKRKEFDILMCFHMLNISLIWLFFFKLLKGKKGLTYLKMDADLRILNSDINKFRFARFIKKMVKSVDLITVETMQLQEFLNTKWNLKTQLIPNGFFDNFERKDTIWEEKKNVIITVGTIGLPRKSNETLLLAFEKFHEDYKDWKLKLIGPIVEPTFQEFIDAYFKRNTGLLDYIEFTGNILDTEVLASYYKESKVFALTSKSEGFPLVFLDALKAGCYIITSNVTSAMDITDQQRIGKVFAVDDVEALTNLLKMAANDQSLLQKNVQKSQDYGYDHFYWPSICKKIDGYLYP